MHLSELTCYYIMMINKHFDSVNMARNAIALPLTNNSFRQFTKWLREKKGEKDKNRIQSS